MNLLRILILVLFSLSISSCAYLHSFDANLSSKIDQWIESQEYGKALDTLSHISPGHDKYDQLMKKKATILQLAKTLEDATISKANKLVAQNQWAEAASLYTESLRKLPNNKRIRQAHSDFIERRQKYLQNLETLLLLNKGAWLDDNETLYMRIKSAIPDNYHSVSGARDYEQDRNKTRQALVECTISATAADMLVLASECLSLAKRMDVNVQDDPRLDDARNKIARARQSRLKDYKNSIADLIDELKHGYSLENLQRAHDHLQSSNQYEPLDTATLELLDDLDARLQTGIEQRMESARRLYSTGKIEPALQIWESLQTIAPDNEKLEAHIERARRVLEKLQRLQQEGASVNPPTEQN